VIAHLHRLQAVGRVTATLDADGVTRYAAATAAVTSTAATTADIERA
jgi:hypothetical protein